MDTKEMIEKVVEILSQERTSQADDYNALAWSNIALAQELKRMNDFRGERAKVE